MKKNHLFDEWNEQKKQVDSFKSHPHIHAGEIWWAKLGQNVATETIGKGEEFLRPVLILKTVYRSACLAIPLTKTLKLGSYYFTFVDSNDVKQCAILPQVRYLDARRLTYKQSYVSMKTFRVLLQRMIDFIKNNPD